MKKIYLLFFVLCFSGWAAIAQTSGTIGFESTSFTPTPSNGDVIVDPLDLSGFSIGYSILTANATIKDSVVWDGNTATGETPSIAFDIDSTFAAAPLPPLDPNALANPLPGTFVQRVVIYNDTTFAPQSIVIRNHDQLIVTGYTGAVANATTVTIPAGTTMREIDLTDLACVDSLVIMTTSAQTAYKQFAEMKVDDFKYELDDVAPTIAASSVTDTTLYLSDVLGAGVASVDSSVLVSDGDYCGTDTIESVTYSYSAADLALSTAWGAENDSIYAYDSVFTSIWDEEGMSDSLNTVIHVLDTTKPTIACITGIDTIYLAGALTTDTIDYTYVLDSARDNDETNALDTVLDKTVFYCAEIGLPVTVTVTVTDYSGNATTCTRDVRLLDTTRPDVVITDATDTITVSLDASGNASVGKKWLGATGSASVSATTTDTIEYYAQNNDTCSSLLHLGVWPKVYTCSDLGYNTDTLFTVDGSGNVDTALFVVQVQDTTPPTLDVDPAITVEIDSSGEYVVRFSDLVINEASDNSTCALDTSIYRIGQTPVADDTVLVTCADIIYHADGTPWEVGDSIVVSLSDGTNTVLDTVELTAKDLIAPVVVPDTLVVNLSDTADWWALSSVATINDCGGLINSALDNAVACEDAGHRLQYTWNTIQDTFTCADEGFIDIWIVVNDIYGNEADTVYSAVQIKDIKGPKLYKATGLDSVYVDASGMVTVNAIDLMDSIKVECSPLDSVSMRIRKVGTSTWSAWMKSFDFGCDTVGTTFDVILQAEDTSGNANTGGNNNAFTMVVLDKIAPSYAGSGITIDLHDTIMSYVLTAWDIADMYAGVEDNCTLLTNTFDSMYQKTFECNDVGTNDVMVRVKDVNGNTGLFTIPVTVQDVTPPMVVTKDATVELTQGGAVVINASTIKVSAWDLCGIDTMYLNAGEYLYTCADTGAHIVHLNVVDIHGNIAVDSAVVTVVDNSAPVITSAMDTVKVTLDAGVCDSMVVLAVSASDNCSVVLTDDAPATFPIGTTVVAYEAVDPSGNTAVDTVVVVVTAAPNAAPTVEAIADVVVGDTLTSVDAAVVATDGGDCPAQTVTIAAVASGAGVVDTVVEAGGTLTVTLVSGAVGTDTVTVTVGDGVATVTETFTVTVNAVNDAPVVTAPVADVTIYVGGDALNVDISGVFTDPDGDVVTVTPSALPAWMDGTVAGVITGTPAAADAGVTTITLTGADPAGLEAEDEFTVTVLDTSNATAVIDIQDAFEVNMYPNPTRDIVTLDVKKAGLNKVDVSIFTVAGTQVFRQVYSTNLIKVNMANQVSGMYFVKMNIDGDQVIKKLILNRK